MLSLIEATALIEKFLPEGKIETAVEYRDIYLFRVDVPRPGEEGMDPFYSVDKNTGETRDFSVITDGDIEEITELFLDADSRKGG